MFCFDSQDFFIAYTEMIRLFSDTLTGLCCSYLLESWRDQLQTAKPVPIKWLLVQIVWWQKLRGQTIPGLLYSLVSVISLVGNKSTISSWLLFKQQY